MLRVCVQPLLLFKIREDELYRRRESSNDMPVLTASLQNRTMYSNGGTVWSANGYSETDIQLVNMIKIKVQTHL